MEEPNSKQSYWVRQQGAHALLGPWTLEQVRKAIQEQDLSPLCELQKATPGAAVERLDANAWSPAWQLLGLPSPPLPPAQELRRTHLLRVREQTHYQFTRNAVKLLAGAVIALVSVAGLLFAVPIVVEGAHGSLAALGLSIAFAIATLCVAAVHIAFVLILRNIALMVADTADCALRADAEPRGLGAHAKPE